MVIKKAIDFAILAHGGKTYGPYPYIYHLHQVDRVLREFGFISDSLRQAAYLHDVLEDTSVSYGELRHAFGDTVANLVRSVTAPKELPNRKARVAWLYSHAPMFGFDETTLKLADRIANMRDANMREVAKREMYKREYAGFNSAMPRYQEHDRMWSELDRLATEETNAGN